jgi:putative ABC transport system substrate-binding protein
MRRRQFIALLGGAAAAWPLAARAQHMPVIGVLGSPTAASWAARFAAFRNGLKEAGFVEGQNLAIESRWADDHYDRLPGMAAELVRKRVSLIAAIGNNLPARAAKAATTQIPIVFAMGADPVQLGVAASLSRPGGNITGVTVLAGELIQKRVQLLHDIVPAAKVFELIDTPENLGAESTGRSGLDLAQEVVGVVGGSLHVVQVRTVADFDAAFANLVDKHVDAAFTSADSVFSSGLERLISLAAQYRLPMIYVSSEFTRAGGLASYSASATDGYRQAGLYAGRILKGAKPSELPVLQPTKFELIFNLKTANALGLTIPHDLLLAADEVIE